MKKEGRKEKLANLPCSSLSKANTALSVVKDSVILLHELVSKDPERASGLRDVHSKKTRHANTRHINNVLTRSECVFDTIKDESEVRKSVKVGAVEPETLRTRNHAAKLAVDLIDEVLGSSDHGRARVDNSLAAVVSTISCAVMEHMVHLDLPIVRVGKRDPLHLAHKVP